MSTKTQAISEKKKGQKVVGIKLNFFTAEKQMGKTQTILTLHFQSCSILRLNDYKNNVVLM